MAAILDYFHVPPSKQITVPSYQETSPLSRIYRNSPQTTRACFSAVSPDRTQPCKHNVGVMQHLKRWERDRVWHALMPVI